MGKPCGEGETRDILRRLVRKIRRDGLGRMCVYCFFLMAILLCIIPPDGRLAPDTEFCQFDILSQVSDIRLLWLNSFLLHTVGMAGAVSLPPLEDGLSYLLGGTKALADIHHFPSDMVAVVIYRIMVAPDTHTALAVNRFQTKYGFTEETVSAVGGISISVLF